jgi:pyruvate kinase
MSLSGAAHRISNDIGAEAVIISSRTPEAALLLSKRRGRTPMVCICTDERQWHGYCLYWGIAAVLVEPQTDLQALLEAGIDSAIAHGFLRDGQQTVVLSHFDDRSVAGIKLQKI